jgi:hypothetical protein
MAGPEPIDMSREDMVFSIAIICLFVVAIAVLVIETRSLWAAEKLIHEGNLTSYSKLEELHVFTFEDNTTSMEIGWLWKTYTRVNRNVRLYRRGQAIIVEEISEPSIG